MPEAPPRVRVGGLLRDWRRRRHLSQLDLALEAGISARHLSFVETGRSRPSPDMVLRLADELDVPLRDRNQLMLAAGYAPIYGQRDLDDPEMAPVREVLERILAGHEPYPALVVDRQWELIMGNATVPLLTAGAAPELLEPPVNVLRVALHPEGLAPRIVNLGEWRAHLLERLHRQVTATGDPGLATLEEELRGYPGPDPAPDAVPNPVAVPLVVRDGALELRFLSTVAAFGTAVDITVAELSIETFLPAEAATAEALRVAGGQLASPAEV
jgi:transcriptional regulator with XRE-family HTH domain